MKFKTNAIIALIFLGLCAAKDLPEVFLGNYRLALCSIYVAGDTIGPV